MTFTAENKGDHYSATVHPDIQTEWEVSLGQLGIKNTKLSTLHPLTHFGVTQLFHVYHLEHSNEAGTLIEQFRRRHT